MTEREQLEAITVGELNTIAEMLKQVPKAQRDALLDMLTMYCRVLDAKEQMLCDLKMKAKE